MHRWHFVFALALALCASIGSVQAQERHLADFARYLDKATPVDARRAIFATWRDDALKGDIDAQYIVGSIYRRGDEAIVRDADQAHRFLSTAAAHGCLFAMAKMAELDLTANRPLDAAIWAQIYGYYRGWAGTKDPQDYGPHDKRQPTVYYEDLLRRTAEALKRDGGAQDMVIAQQVNAFIAAHDKDVQAQKWIHGISPRWAGDPLKLTNAASFRQVSVPLGKRDITSEWLLDFAPDGSVRRAILFDALPDAIDGSTHHGLVVQYEVEKEAVADRYALRTVDMKKGDWQFGPTRTR